MISSLQKDGVTDCIEFSIICEKFDLGHISDKHSRKPARRYLKFLKTAVTILT